MSIATANDDLIPLFGIGTIVTPSPLSLSDVYYILCDSRFNVCFSPFECYVHDRTYQKVIEIGRRQCELYVLNQFKESIVVASSVNLSSFRLSSSSSSFYLWHSRLGHVSASRLKFLVSTRVMGLDNHDISYCSDCKLANFFVLPFNKSISSSLAPFDLVHSDVWDLLLYLPKEVLDIMSLSLMILLVLLGSIFYLMKCWSDFLTI